jgi:hypothetical protein
LWASRTFLSAGRKKKGLQRRPGEPPTLMLDEAASYLRFSSPSGIPLMRD